MNKKLITILMSGLMVFSMVACGEKETNEKVNREPETMDVILLNTPDEAIEEILIDLDKDDIVYLRNIDKDSKLLTLDGEEIEIVGDVDWDKSGEYKVIFKFKKDGKEVEVEKTLYVGSGDEIKEHKEQIAKAAEEKAKKEAEEAENQNATQQPAEQSATQNAAQEQATEEGNDGFTEADSQNCYVVTLGDANKLEEVYGIDFALWCNDKYPDLFNIKDYSLELSETWVNK